MKHLFTILLLIVSMTSFSQSYYLGNGFIPGDTIYTNTGTFYDSGGDNGYYQAGENYRVTFCPTDTSLSLKLQFSLFEIMQGDTLRIIDGYPSKLHREMGEFTSKFSPQPYNLTAGVDNADGCLTVFFKSQNQNGRWLAQISTASPCQNSIPGLAMYPAVVQSGMAYTCSNSSVALFGFGTYPFNGTYYSQGDLSSQFLYLIEDSLHIFSAFTSYAFTKPGESQFSLKMKDVNNCLSLGEKVVPLFCDGVLNTDALYASYNDTALITAGTSANNTIQMAPTPFPLFRSDNKRVILDNSVINDTVKVVAGQNDAIIEPGFFPNFYFDLEHSYMGDLSIRVKCPNGNHVLLKQYPGGSSTQLGEPVDDEQQPMVAGIPYKYGITFNPLNQMGTMVDESGTYTYSYTDVLGNEYIDKHYLPSATYLAFETPDPLIGCPVNGDWVVTITDHMTYDQGFLFSWGIEFDPSLVRISTEVVSYASSASPHVTNSNDTTLSVNLPFCGQTNIPVTIYTKLGCSFQTNVMVMIPENNYIEILHDTLVCNGDTVRFETDLFGNVFWSNGQQGASAYLIPREDTYFGVTVQNSGCNFIDSAFVQVTPESPQISMNVIGGDSALISTPASSYQWYLNGVVIQGANSDIYYPEVTGAYSVEISNDGICYALSDEYYFVFANTNEHTNKHSIQIFPNPVNDICVVTFCGQGGYISLIIRSIEGKIVYETITKSQANCQRIHINTSEFNQGIYWVEVLSNNHSSVEKMVIVRSPK